MITYAVCDQDGFISLSVEGDIAHYAANPTHTSHIGIGGDTSSPVPYSAGSGTVTEVSTDPSSPTAGQTWVLHSASAIGGSPIGLLLSLTQTIVANTYLFSYYTSEGTIVRTVLQ